VVGHSRQSIDLIAQIVDGPVARLALAKDDVPSSAADRIAVPSGLNCTSLTASPCHRSTTTSASRSTSQTRIVRSALPVTTRFPPASNAALDSAAVWPPRSTFFGAPLPSTSQTRGEVAAGRDERLAVAAEFDAADRSLMPFENPRSGHRLIRLITTPQRD